MSDVTDTLDALARGDKTLGEVIVDFQGRQWPQTRPTDPTVLLDRDNADPEPMVSGSFDEVASAFDRGVINQQQYAALAHAVAAAQPAAPAADATAAPDDAPAPDATADAGSSA